MKRIALALLVTIAAAHAARAEDVATYETDGSSAAALADARNRALDVAFAAAVQGALADLVAPADLTSFRGDLDRVIVARARLYVASFKVTAEETRGDELHVSAAVRIDRDRVRAKLTELGVPIKAVAGPPGTGPQPVTHARAVVLIRINAPTPRQGSDGSGGGSGAVSVVANYGAAAADSVPGLEAIDALVRASGAEIAPAPRSGPAAHADGDLPLDDESARALAGDAKAGTVVIVGVSVEGAGPVRGVRAEGASAIAHVRVLAGDQVIGSATVRAGAYAAEDPSAIARAEGNAALAAVTAAVPAAEPGADGAAAVPPPPPLHPDAGIVLVRVRGLVAWAPIKAITAQLAQTSGVDKVVMLRFAPGEIALAVTTKQRAERIAAAVRATEGFSGRAATDDGAVVVTP